MATGFLSPIGMLVQLFSEQGVVGLGFKINTYVGGSVSTPVTTYTDSTLTVPNTNPIIMGSNGRFQNVSVWAPSGTLIKMVITDALNNLITGGTIDNIPLINDVTASGIGTVLYPQSPAELAASVTPVNYSYSYGNPRRQGAPIDGIASARAALNTQNSTGEQIYLTRGTYLVDSNLTLSSSVTCESGAIFKVANGVTLSFTGPFAGSISQHFQVLSAAGALSSVYGLAGGSLYVNGTYNNVPLTGGQGQNVQATVVVSGAAVTSVTITAFGANYRPGDVLSASNTNLGGAGSGFSCKAIIAGIQFGSAANQTPYVPIQPACPEWWGALGVNGAANPVYSDDTAAVQACVSEAITAGRKVVLNQDYPVSQVVLVGNELEIDFQGFNLNANFVSCSFTASIAPAASGSLGVMVVTAISSGQLGPGHIVNGAGLATNTQIISQITGTTNSTGSYVVSVSQTVSSEAMTTLGPLSVLDIKCGYSTLRDVRVDQLFNPNYQSCIHWYTNSLTVFYPGFNRIYGMWPRNALVGLCIGGLPNQSVPCPAQNSVQNAGTATDAPLSESSVFSLQETSCVIGLYMKQPNGKVGFVNSTIRGDHAGWSNYGSSGYTNASTCAAILNLDPTQSNELAMQDGSFEQLSDSTGQLLQCTNSHCYFDGTTIETVATTFISGSSAVSFDKCLDMGFQFPVNYTPFQIDQGAAGELMFHKCVMGLPTGNIAAGSGVPFVKSVAGLGGSFGINTKGFSVYWNNVELRDVSTQPNNGTNTFLPTVSGLETYFGGCKYVSYNGTPAITLQLDVNDGPDLLKGQVDQSAYTVLALGLNGNTASGGWTFTCNAADSWGSAASGLPALIEKTIDKCVQIGSGAIGSGHSTNAISPKFAVVNQKPLFLRAWLKAGVTGSLVVIQMNWFKFDATASATASTVLFNAADSVIGSSIVNCMYLVNPPKDACQAQVQFNCQNGAILQFTFPRLQ